MGEIADMMIEAQMNDGWVDGDDEMIRVDPETLEVFEIRKKKKPKSNHLPPPKTP